MPGTHQSPAVHAIALAMNSALGNFGKTVVHTDPPEVESADQMASLRELVNDIDSGAVEVLLILGGNPVYDAPADFDFSSLLRKVKTTVHVALHSNETSVECQWQVPESHFLEDWGDTRAFDGTVTILQPLILPLYDSISYLSLLDFMLKPPGRSSYEIVRAYWQKKSAAEDFEQWWRKSVHDGLIAGSELPTITPQLKPDWAMSLSNPQLQQGMEVGFRPDPPL